MLLQATTKGVIKMKKQWIDNDFTQEHYTNLAIMMFLLSWAWTMAAVINNSFNPVWGTAGFATGIYFMVQRNYMLLTGR